MAKLPSGCRKRENGTYELRFTENGKRYSVYGATPKECKEKQLERIQELQTVGYITNKNITLDKYFQEWIQEKQGTVKGNTINSYKNVWNSVKDELGNKKVANIERREIIALQKSLLDKGYNTYTVNHTITILHQLFKSAVTNEIIIKNPCDSIKTLKRIETKASETTHRALTPEEQKQFMEQAKTSYYYEFLSLMLSSGMRIGEVAALSWNDIDYFKNVIHVTKTVARDSDGNITIDTPKSISSKRDIPLTETIKQVLKMQKEKSKLWSQSNIISLNNRQYNFIFLNQSGEIILNGSINLAIRKILTELANKNIIIEDFSSHAFRDTFATRFIEQGGSLQTLKTILGHESLTMTADLYAHVLPNTKQEEMDKINIVI